MPRRHYCYQKAALSKAKSGISPVIAALILVAIAVILASALSGFASSLLGTYSHSPQISVQSLGINQDGTGRVIFYNEGAMSDSVLALQVIPNAPMDLTPSSGQVTTTQNPPSNDGTGGDEDTQNEHLPQCQEHTDVGNCMHDQDRGQSGDSSGHQSDNTSSGGSNSGTENNGSGQGNNGSNGNPGGKFSADGILLPPYAETDISWAESSVGEFSPGEKITVLIYLQSGNRLTYSSIVS